MVGALSEPVARAKKGGEESQVVWATVHDHNEKQILAKITKSAMAWPLPL